MYTIIDTEEKYRLYFNTGAFIDKHCIDVLSLFMPPVPEKMSIFLLQIFLGFDECRMIMLSLYFIAGGSGKVSYI